MINVAIIEDNFHYRSALIKLLEGTDTIKLHGVYSTAEEALPGLVNRQPDVAIVDIQLPEMSGISLVEKIYPVMPHTQFLMCTLHQDNDNIFEALRAGASGYILKDASPEDIKNAVKEVYMGGAPMSPYIARKIIGLFQQKLPEPNQYGLSDREMEVLKLMSRGLLYKEIAEKLTISKNTVKNHLKTIYKKLHVQNKIEAINKFKSA